ncbi:S9 family peptidase [Salinactinospora qingdaonensis]|uniref:Prolyl oligopeptidase family serine peptidase n=1 Tax=Salinactinospora qingdaonensis TaxID=702744 RepID=A0ABP7FK05_9ACTN
MSFPRQQARTRRFTLGVPKGFQISPDGRRVIFLRGRHGTDAAACLWVLELDSGREWVAADPQTVAAEADNTALPPQERARRERLRETGGGIVSYTVDDACALAAFTLAGQLFIATLTEESTPPRELATAGAVIDPMLDPTGTKVAYVSEGAVRVIGVDGTGDRVLAEPDAENVTWGLADFIAAEEMGRYRGMWWAPDGSALLATRVDDSPVTRWHIADPASPATEPQVIAYPAAGTRNTDTSLAVLALSQEPSGAVEPRFLRWDRAALPYVVTGGWTVGADQRPTVVFTAQSRDQRTMTVLRAAPDSEHTTELLTETDTTWVEIMPGVPAFTGSGELVWIGTGGDGEQRRLHIGKRPVSAADQYVRAVVDVDGDQVLYAASGPTAPGEISLWLAQRDADQPTPVRFPDTAAGGATEAPGLHSGRLRGGTLVLQRRDLDTDSARTVAMTDIHSPDHSSVADIASLAERPDLPTPRPHTWRATDREIPCALLLPSWHEPGSGSLPVLLDPYGGPHAQRVVHARGAYLTAQWLAEQGFAVLIADGRGTPGIGTSWEQAVRGDLATPVLADQVAALHDAAERFGELDLSRVAIRGWSFGGYLAALAVLRRPDVFHAAIAGAPVTDWKLYDTHYTERYLGLPQEQPDHYATSSLLDEAAGLRRPLLLIHGLADDNVVFAHTQQLSSALLAAGRPHTVLPLSGITHMASEESTAENLLVLQVKFLREALSRGRGEVEGSEPS